MSLQNSTNSNHYNSETKQPNPEPKQTAINTREITVFLCVHCSPSQEVLCVLVCSLQPRIRSLLCSCVFIAAQDKKSSVQPQYQVHVRDATDAERKRWRSSKTLNGELDFSVLHCSESCQTVWGK